MFGRNKKPKTQIKRWSVLTIYLCGDQNVWHKAVLEDDEKDLCSKHQTFLDWYHKVDSSTFNFNYTEEHYGEEYHCKITLVRDQISYFTIRPEIKHPNYTNRPPPG